MTDQAATRVRVKCDVCDDCLVVVDGLRCVLQSVVGLHHRINDNTAV